MKLYLLIQYLLSSALALPTPTPYYIESDSLLHFTAPVGADAQTMRMIDQQNRMMDSGGGRDAWSMQDSINQGHQRAQEMVNLLKDQQLQKAFAPLNARGKQMLQESPEMRNPVAIVGGAVALWVGRSIQLLRGDGYKITSRVEMRSRSGEFAMESPILNGRLTYTGNDGVNMKVNRKIDSISATVEANYSARDQTFSGNLIHPLVPHLDLSFGASQIQQTNQTDSRASLNYNLNF